MSGKSKIRWQKSDSEELNRAVKNFNAKITRIAKKNPELENALHKYFDSKRVNLVNNRKEFFYVTLDEIEKFAKDHNVNVEFTKIAEAKDFRESESIRNSKINNKKKKDNFSEEIPISI